MLDREGGHHFLLRRRRLDTASRCVQRWTLGHRCAAAGVRRGAVRSKHRGAFGALALRVTASCAWLSLQCWCIVQVTSRITPLHAAARGGQDDVIDMLLDRGVNVDELDDVGAATACLSLTCSALLQVIVPTPLCTQLGETALMKAAYSGHRDAVQLLLERHANKQLRAMVRVTRLADGRPHMTPPG
jgi:hypothetical protein